MDYISIVKANPISEVGGKLNSMALDYMAYPLIGSKDSKLIEGTLDKLWMYDSNRFSHQFAFEAQHNNKTVGMIICYPVSLMKKLALPTFRQLMKLRAFSLIGHSITHIKELLSIISLNEGRDGEYHIGTVATLPGSQGHGIGTKLINFAEEQAKQNHYDKCSLTVKKENEQALKLYEKLGFQIVDAIDKKPYSLYRMVKTLYPSLA